MKIKVCGMGSPENIQEVATLQPDYLGFIFFEKSARNFTGIIPNVSDDIVKTGIFVNATIEFIYDKILQYKLQAVQLHGSESPRYCEKVKALNVEVFKVFSVKKDFDFELLTPYEPIVDYFLFDTKGEQPGGNGFVFDWNLLKNYNSKVPFILSGGIGLEQVDDIKELLKRDLPIYALDLNSRFELKPAKKDIALLEEFLNKIKHISSLKVKS
jgi:phosphoribosylanthranilate isomerase